MPYINKNGMPCSEEMMLENLKSVDRDVDYDEFTYDGDDFTVSTSYHGTSSAYKTSVSVADKSHGFNNCVFGKSNVTDAQTEHDRVVTAIKAGESL